MFDTLDLKKDSFSFEVEDLTEEKIRLALQNGFRPNASDLLAHPSFCKNRIFMQTLIEFDSSYEVFDYNLSFERKRGILTACLIEKDAKKFLSLPFLTPEYGYEGGAAFAYEVVKLLFFEIEEEDQNTQQFYYQRMNQLLDGLALASYRKMRRFRAFSDYADINEKVLFYLKRYSYAKDQEFLSLLADEIVFETKKENLTPYYRKKVEELAQVYEKERRLPRELTTPFYRKILQFQQQYFTKKKKKEWVERLTCFLPLTSSMSQKIQISDDLKALSAEEIKQMVSKEEIERLHEKLYQWKKLKKEGIVLDSKLFMSLDDLFFQNQLTKEGISSVFPQASKRGIKMLVNQYTKVILSHLPSFRHPTAVTMHRSSYPYHYHNYKIATNYHIASFLAELLLISSKQDLEDIFYQGKKDPSLRELLPIFGYFKETSAEALKNIYANYSMILRHMKEERKIHVERKEEVMNHFDQVLLLSQAYGSVDDISLAVLGQDRVDKIVSFQETSQDSKKYLNTYLAMIKEKKVTIPPISGTYQYYSYATAENFDVERLMIGKNCDSSCIGPDNAGEAAFYECLTQETGDVLMIRDQETQEFVARALLFRRGNFVIMDFIHDRLGIASQFYTKDFLVPLGMEMMAKAKEQGDNLEYFFVNDPTGLLEEEFPTIEHLAFVDSMPHADLEEFASLITPHEGEIDPNPSLVIEGSYDTVSSPLKRLEEVTEKEMDRLLALDVLLEEKKSLREEKARNFEPFQREKYEELYKGDEFYLGILKDHSLEMMCLPTMNSEKRKQVEAVRDYLLEENQNRVQVDFKRGSLK